MRSEQPGPFGSTEPSVSDTGISYLPARKVWERYGVTDMTLYRWIRDRQFPPPDFVKNGRRYWRASTIEAHDAGKAGL